METQNNRIKSYLYLGLGWLCFALGFIGIFLPILPTTPFMIVALWAFSKGSKKMHTWLLTHPRFGKTLRDWEEHKVIPIRAKITAFVFILASAIYIIFFANVPIYAAVLSVSTMACAITYVLTRPSKPTSALGRSSK
ncbi:MAG: YbaN family protein [Hyphomicrobiales bacterium]